MSEYKAEEELLVQPKSQEDILREREAELAKRAEEEREKALEMRKHQAQYNLSEEQCYPMPDRLVIRLEAIQEVSKAGLYIPKMAAESMRPARGVVIAVGSECPAPPWAPHGDLVGSVAIFMPYAGSIIEMNQEHVESGEEEVYRVVRWKEVHCVFPPECRIEPEVKA